MGTGGNPENIINNGRPFKKGQSGNPSGYPSRMRALVTAALRDKLASVDLKTKQTYAQRFAEIWVKCVTDPDPELDKTRLDALTAIVDRCEGKPKQQIDLNDVTAELRNRSDEDLMFHMEHDCWPEDAPLKVQRQHQKMLEGKITQ